MPLHIEHHVADTNHLADSFRRSHLQQLRDLGDVDASFVLADRQLHVLSVDGTSIESGWHQLPAAPIGLVVAFDCSTGDPPTVALVKRALCSYHCAIVTSRSCSPQTYTTRQRSPATGLRPAAYTFEDQSVNDRWVADEDHVGSSLEVAAGAELVDQLTVDAGLRVEVEVLECRWCW
jgi:hypothetical protein